MSHPGLLESRQLDDCWPFLCCVTKQSKQTRVLNVLDCKYTQSVKTQTARKQFRSVTVTSFYLKETVGFLIYATLKLRWAATGTTLWNMTSMIHSSCKHWDGASASLCADINDGDDAKMKYNRRFKISGGEERKYSVRLNRTCLNLLIWSRECFQELKLHNLLSTRV